MGGKCFGYWTQEQIHSPKVVVHFGHQEFRVFYIPATFKQLEAAVHSLLQEAVPGLAPLDYVVLSHRSADALQQIKHEEDYSKLLSSLRGPILHVYAALQSFATLFDCDHLRNSSSQRMNSLAEAAAAHQHSVEKVFHYVQRFKVRLAELGVRLTEPFPGYAVTLLLVAFGLDAHGDPRNLGLAFIKHSPYIQVDSDALSPWNKSQFRLWNKMTKALPEASYVANTVYKRLRKLQKQLQKSRVQNNNASAEWVKANLATARDLKSYLQNLEEDIDTTCTVVSGSTGKRQLKKLYSLMQASGATELPEVLQFFGVQHIPLLT